MKDLIYCGFGIYYDADTSERFEKTASGEFTAVDDGVTGSLERSYVRSHLEKLAVDKGGKL